MLCSQKILQFFYFSIKAQCLICSDLKKFQIQLSILIFEMDQETKNTKQQTLENFEADDQQKTMVENCKEKPLSEEPEERFGHKPTIVYRPQIDGLRCLAILPVICFHYHLFEDYTSGGFGGVDVFFVISGFLVNSIIISDLLKEKFSLLVFYERRVRRLFPAIFLTLSVFFISGYFLFFEKELFQQLVKEQLAAVSNYANFYFYDKRDDMGDGYFDDNTQTWTFLHFWSLAVQEQFYILTPLALMLLMNFAKKAKFIKCMLIYSIATIVISLALSIWITEQNQMAAFYLLPCRAWELGIGGLIAILLNDSLIEKIKQLLSSRSLVYNQKITTIFLEITSWLGLLMILFSYAFYNKREDHFPGYKALLPCCGVAIFIAANFIRYDNSLALPQNAENSELQLSSEKHFKAAPKRIVLTSARALSWKPFVFIGEISYSLYLWHWPVWVFCNYVLGNYSISYINKIFCVALTFMIATLSTRQIENTIRNKKKVPTSLLWKGFVILWAGFVSLLLFNMIKQTGGIEMKSPELFDLRYDSNQTLYPKYDAENYLLKNPYRSLVADQVSLLKMGNPTYTNQSLRYAYKKVTKGPIGNMQPVLVNYENKNKKQKNRICLASLGSSHTEQHTEVLRELSLQYNVSFGVLSATNTRMQFFTRNLREWDQWRIAQLKALKPKMIFIQNFWYQYRENAEQNYKNILDFLLGLQNPPQYIGIFGDNPFIDVEGYSASFHMKKNLQRKFQKDNNSWKFIERLEGPLNQQIQVEDKIARFIKQNYNNGIVHFYPHIYQFMQDPQTGYMQVVGSEVDGQILYRDHSHLLIGGSRRYRNYFQKKIFLMAQELCKEQ